VWMQTMPMQMMKMMKMPSTKGAKHCTRHERAKLSSGWMLASLLSRECKAAK
jgi:hypothetical protein